MKQISPLLLGLAGALAMALPASAATTSQAIVGKQSAQENGCIDAIHIFTVNDCSYNDVNHWWTSNGTYDPPLATLTQADVTPPIYIDGYVTDFDRNWIGPLANQMYYEKGDSPLANGTVPTVGDNKAELGLTGQLTIDDSGTPADGTDDKISGVIVIAAGTRNVLTGQAASSRVEESWDALTQTMIPTLVHSATLNAHGGFDYVIASRGMPDILQPVGLNDQAYPSEIASSPILNPAASGWVAPDSQGRSPSTIECLPPNPTQVLVSWRLPQNVLRVGSTYGPACADPSSRDIGATTTGVFTNWSCISSTGGACPNNAAILGKGRPGYQNLLIAVSTDAAGHIVSSFAMYAHQYPVLGFLFGFSADEGWDGGTLTTAGLTNAGSFVVRPSGGSPDINPKAGGSVSTVLYSNTNLDATAVTGITAGTGAVEKHGAGHIQDVNSDGLDDLVLHFQQNETGVACGDTSLTLHGTTAAGWPIAATATINVVGCD